MERLIVTIIVFLVIYFLYFITVLCNKKKLKEFEKSGQASFIIRKYELDIVKLEKKKFANTIALTNSLIISITFFVTDFIPNYLFKLLVGFILLIPLIILGYHWIGLYYKKKEVKKHV